MNTRGLTRLVNIAGQGECLVAAGNYERGHLIWNGRPLLTSFKSLDLMETLCSMCNCPVDKKMACGGCMQPRYCTVKCQRAHWSWIHKLECSYLNKMLPRRPVGALSLVIRCLLLIRDGPEIELMALESHTEEQIATNRIPDLDILVQGISHLIEEPDLALIADIYRKVVINSIEYVELHSPSTGAVLDSYFLAKMNHSCRPNCFVTFDKGIAIVRALSTIKVGEIITISYLGPRAPFKYSQTELKLRYYFDCKCARCSNFPHVDDDISLCEEIYWCSCKEPVYPDAKGDHRCTHCANDFADYEKLNQEGWRILHDGSSTLEEIAKIIESLRKFSVQKEPSEPLYSLVMQARELASVYHPLEALNYGLSILRFPLKEFPLPDELLHIFLTSELAFAVAYDPRSPALVFGLSQVKLLSLAWYMAMYVNGRAQELFRKTAMNRVILDSFDRLQRHMSATAAERMIMSPSLLPWADYTDRIQFVFDIFMSNIESG